LKIPTPRPYQKQALNNIYETYPDENRLGLFWATGTGKGMVPIWLAQMYSEFIKETGMLFIADRRKLLFQAYERFQEAWGDEFTIGLEMGEYEAAFYEDVIFMSAPSVGRVYQNRITKYENRKFGIIQVDEAHRLHRESIWDRILGFFGVGADSSSNLTVNYDGQDVEPLLISYTATPEGRMVPFVDETVHSMSVLEGIKRGWLTDIKSYHVTGADDITKLCSVYKEYLKDETTLIFASSVDESKELTQALNDAGIVNAVHIDAETPKSRREDIYNAFDSGVAKALSNRKVAVEGVDIPNMTAILDNAPTDNQRIFTQKIGRALRPHSEAKIDECETAEERKKEIQSSPKPFATLICTYDPTEVGITLTQALTGREIDLDEEDKLAVEEVIEVLEEYEEERPEVDLSQMDNIDPSDFDLREADIFRRTIYNDRLKGLTKLNWVTIDSDTMGLWLPQNPFTSEWTYKNCETVVLLRVAASDDAKAEQRENVSSVSSTIQRKLISGGWNGSFPAKVKAVGWKETRHDNMQRAIKAVDDWLRRNRRDLWTQSLRGSSENASSKLKEHLRNKGVPVSDDLTDETAQLLKADRKIRHKIKKVDG